MGQVFRARHLTLGCDVAIKLIRPSGGEGGARMLRFEREARTAASLRSAHVVQVLDHGVDDDTAFIVMELLLGESLRDRLKRAARLSPLELGRLLTHLCRALERAHARGVVHRDLKPENVFLVADESGPTAKVLDFGIAKASDILAEPSAITESGAILGTPAYMSPEQLRGRHVDFAADVWSLAVIAFECLCARAPFTGASLADLIVHISTGPIPVPSTIAEVPEGFDDWFSRGVRREPRERFGSARELCEAYLALLPEVSAELMLWPEETTVSPLPATTPSERDQRGEAADRSRATLAEPTTGSSAPVGPRTLAPASRRRWFAKLAVVGLLAVATGTWLYSDGRSGPQPEEPDATRSPVSTESQVDPAESGPARPSHEVPTTHVGAPLDRSSTSANSPLPTRPSARAKAAAPPAAAPSASHTPSASARSAIERELAF